MQTDLHVEMSERPEIATAELLAGLGQFGMAGALMCEWPSPSPFSEQQLAFNGEILLAWPDDENAGHWRAMVRAGDWRGLVHANYDMRIDGVTLARIVPAQEIMRGDATGFHACLQPHGGSRLLHATIAQWVADRTGGTVVDPFAEGGWRRLLPGSIANPDRVGTASA